MSAEQSPKGDLGAKSESQRQKFFKKAIKAAGGTDSGTGYLPYRKPQTAIDPKYGPGDKVCS